MKNNDIVKTNYTSRKSSHSIRRLLSQRWIVVVTALILTGLGAALTGVLFKSGVHQLDEWRLTLLKAMPAWFVLPILGGLGGLISGTLIQNFAPAAIGAGVSLIIAFLRH